MENVWTTVLSSCALYCCGECVKHQHMGISLVFQHAHTYLGANQHLLQSPFNLILLSFVCVSLFLCWFSLYGFANTPHRIFSMFHVHSRLFTWFLWSKRICFIIESHFRSIFNEYQRYIQSLHSNPYLMVEKIGIKLF